MKGPLDGTILVTGGAGFIGSALVWALNQRGLTDIVIADFLGEDEKWRNLVPLCFTDYLEADDLTARIELGDPALANVTAVFHLGACSATTERNARYLIQNNFEYTKTLARWSLAGKRRFVYASSAATYGDGSAGMVDGTTANPALRPLNMYGYSKHLFDLYADRAGWLENIVGLKYFNVYGPNEDHKGDMRSVVHKAFHEITETGRLKLFQSHRDDYAHGEQQRDFLYVKDAVAMTIHLAETTAANGLYNLGSGVARTWNDLARAVFAAMHSEPAIDYIPMPEPLRGKYQYYTCADVTRLRESGYTAPITSLEDAVRDDVQQYLARDLRLGDET